MSARPVYLASDAHLGAAPPDMELAFARWLEHAGAAASLVFLNGDVFDFWFEWKAVVPRGHTRVLAVLAEIVDSGVPVHLMGGNHDWWGGRYLTDEIGVVFHQEPVRMALAGRRCLIAHGDGLGAGDWKYRALKWVLRSGPTQWAFRWIHPDISVRIARGVSRTQVHEEGPSEGATRRADALERWARDTLLESEDLDLVVLGHSHVPRKVEVAPGRFYVNAGDWLTNGTYLVLEGGAAPSLLSWRDNHRPGSRVDG
jgi:UDP-2,3-diacylglucosamine hydrolase